MALKDVAVRKAKAFGKPKKLSDGGGLYVLVQPTGSKLWRLAYRFAGNQKTPPVCRDARRLQLAAQRYAASHSIRAGSPPLSSS